MNVSTMDTVRTMAITHMSYETKRYTEADYDTAVEYSVMNIMDEEYLLSLHLGEFEVLVEIDTSLTKTSHFYILQEYGNRHEHDVEKGDSTSFKRAIRATVFARKSKLQFDVNHFDPDEIALNEILAGWSNACHRAGEVFAVNPQRLSHLFDAVHSAYHACQKKQ